mmetsp:Transcript_31547/g.79641  ORF Transcript_31547/g.79641 Transcript_31547/m.79641 type:complete len:202 (+) Transcript_31547:474-1079(+)
MRLLEGRVHLGSGGLAACRTWGCWPSIACRVSGELGRQRHALAQQGSCTFGQQGAGATSYRGRRAAARGPLPVLQVQDEGQTRICARTVAGDGSCARSKRGSMARVQQGALSHPRSDRRRRWAATFGAAGDHCHLGRARCCRRCLGRVGLRVPGALALPRHHRGFRPGHLEQGVQDGLRRPAPGHALRQGRVPRRVLVQGG